VNYAPARITPRTYQNGYITEKQAPELRSLGITHLLNLDLPYAETKIVMPADLKVVEMLLYDMAPMSTADARRVVAIIQRAVELEGGKIYVHCNAGLSRSPTAVWLYLVASDWDPAKASETIGTAATHLDAPDPILIDGLDIDDLRTWARRSRWEVWRRGEKTYPNLLSVHGTPAEAQAAKAQLDAELSRLHGRGFGKAVYYWTEEVRPPDQTTC